MAENSDPKHPIDRAVTRLVRRLADRGLLIQAGWVLFAEAAFPGGLSPERSADLQLAFMAGAGHLFATTGWILEDGEDLTEVDVQRLDSISAELQKWKPVIEERIWPTQGRA